MQKTISVQISAKPELLAAGTRTLRLKPEEHGYYSLFVPEAARGMFYKFKVARGAFPDPASRFQPQGPHGPSQIIDPSGFRWTDRDWTGIPQRAQVLYEMHVGTFTRGGTWKSAMKQLPALASLGITVLELMPVADFPGRFGWGYDGVNMFAPTRLYGEPADMKRFVNQAHQLGLGVILDVVYNHLGPDGNYLTEFSHDYFTDRYKNEWGQPINFDGENSAPVREFFLSNAAYWVEEFHLDGLRLDATQQIFDASPNHILGAITRTVRQAAHGRRTLVIAENEPQHLRLVRPFEAGGLGMDGIWNDDFHHSATTALTGHNEAYYLDYQGKPQEFISMAKRGTLYQGQWSAWQSKPRGTPSRGIPPLAFVNFIQNHDQIANSLWGARIHELTTPGKLRAMTALLLLMPGTPMLFQGQEFAASALFNYFADHQPELASLVRGGRQEFMCQFPSICDPEATSQLPDPCKEATFLRCKLDWNERNKHAPIYALHRDLLRLRAADPVFSQPKADALDGAVLGEAAFALRFPGPSEDDRLVLVNLGLDLVLSPAPEPLLAPPESTEWCLAWSSESPAYGGGGTPAARWDGQWRLPGNCALVMKPRPAAVHS